jgi:hypothetical protein
MEDRYYTLAEATSFALENGGEGLLDNPRRFLAHLADMMDPDCDDLRVLERNCDEGLLRPYREALAGALKLDAAEARAHSYLQDECKIESGTAAAVASGIAEGMASLLGASARARSKVAVQVPSGLSPEEGRDLRARRDRTLVVTPAPQTADISGASVEPIAPQRHTGRPLCPVPRVSLGGSRLVSGRDYTLSYSSNVGYPDRESTATVKVVGAGAYSGSLVAAFRILPPERPRPSRGRDVRVDLEVSELEARDGASKRVEYDLPSGGRRESCEVRVPAGSANLALVRVSGMGDMGADGGERGDLLVRLIVSRDPSGWSLILTRRAALFAGGMLGLAGIAALAAARHRISTDRSLGIGTEGSSEDVAGTDEEPAEEPEQEVVDDQPEEEPEELKPVTLVAISAGSSHTVGLRSDGTAVATGDNDDGRCDVSGWGDLVAVSARGWHTVGLRSDGTAVATGYNGSGQCDVSGWHDLVAVSASWGHTVGLRSDGTAVATGRNDDGQCDVSGW